MNRYVVALLLVWGSLIMGCVRHMPEIVVPLPKKTRSATVAMVDVEDPAESSKAEEAEPDDGKEKVTTRPYCSGVWVNDNTFVTAHHCAKASIEIKALNKMSHRERIMAMLFGIGLPDASDEEIMKSEIRYITSDEVVDPEKNPTKTFAAKVVVLDKDHDLAVIRAEGTIPRHMSAPIATKLPGVGEEVVAMGHPSGLYFTYSKGTFAAVRKELPVDKKGPWVQLIVPGVYKGNSGGGAFDSHGCIVGIASFMVRAPNEVMYVHPDTVHELLKKNKIDHKYAQ